MKLGRQEDSKTRKIKNILKIDLFGRGKRTENKTKTKKEGGPG